jgi:hypothetical protein
MRRIVEDSFGVAGVDVASHVEHTGRVQPLHPTSPTATNNIPNHTLEHGQAKFQGGGGLNPIRAQRISRDALIQIARGVILEFTLKLFPPAE